MHVCARPRGGYRILLTIGLAFAAVPPAFGGGLTDMLGLGPCAATALVVSPALATFGFSASASGYPGGEVPADTVLQLSDTLGEYAPKIADARLRADVTTMAAEIGDQAGKSPMTPTPALTAAMQDYSDWMTQNCAGPENTAAAGTAETGQTESDAPAAEANVVFRTLPGGAMAILDNALAVQTGPAGKPEVQVIFDPNNPYDAALWRNLQQMAPEVPVRWLPVSYMAEDSGAIAATILDSADPAAMLATDFANYDKRSGHGGVKPKDGESLGSAQDALQKAWIAWGGYTPMLIVNDADGMLVQTGGSSEEIIAATLRRAGLL